MSSRKKYFTISFFILTILLISTSYLSKTTQADLGNYEENFTTTAFMNPLTTNALGWGQGRVTLNK